MKTFIAAALLIATAVLLAAPALAQGSGGGERNPMDVELEQRKKTNDEADRAYRATLKNTTQTKEVTKTDPWGNARAPSTEKK